MLRRYSKRLDAVRREAAQATERAWVAERARAAASAARDAAAARVSALGASLGTARVTERTLYVKYNAEKLANAPTLATTYTQYKNAVNRRAGLESQHGQAENDRRYHERRALEQKDALDRERGLVNELREHHREEEKRTADELLAAMPEALRNASFWSKTGDWIGDRVEGVVEFAEEFAHNIEGIGAALADGDYLRAVFYLREALSRSREC